MTKDQYTFETIAHAMGAKQQNDIVRGLRKAGYSIERDRETVKAFLDGQVVYRALKIRSFWSVRAAKGLLTPVTKQQ